MKDLVIFCFETGDASVPYWQEFVLIDHEQIDYYALKNIIESYINSDESNDEGYEDAVIDIMNASGWRWEWFVKGTSVQGVYTYWI